MTKPKILWLSDSPTTSTGYATATMNILNGLSDEFECHCIGHNYYGHTLKPGLEFEDGTKLKFYLHGTGRAKYGLDVVPTIIKKIDADFFGILLDTFMVYPDYINYDFSPAKTFFYFPSDGGGRIPHNCEQILNKCYFNIGMSEFASKQAELKHNVNSYPIPLGYNEKHFYPLSEDKKQKAKKKWNFENKFVVGCIARNQGRKMWDRIIKAFAVWCKDKPDVILFLHTDPYDPAKVFDMPQLITDLGLNNRIVFSGTSFYKPFNPSEMNEIYNIMDIFLLLTSGEGWGMPIVEAQACGIPQIVTDYTTSREIIKGKLPTGELVNLVGSDKDTPDPHINEILEGTILGSWQVDRGVASINDAVKKLNLLYNDQKLRQKYSKNSIKNSKKYEWGEIIKQWKKVLKEKLKE